MRRIALFLIFIIAFSSLVVAFELDGIISTYENSEYTAKRVFIEESEIFGVKMRYETVYKWGTDKLVVVSAPSEVVWLRKDDESWMGKDGTLYRMPIILKDLSDLAFELLQAATDVEVEEELDEIFIRFTSIKGKFEIIIKDSSPYKITRELNGIKMELEYKEYEETQGKDDILRNYTLSDRYAIPEELGVVLELLDWFVIEGKEDGVISIKGIYHGKLIDLKISLVESEGCVKVGNYCIYSDCKEFLEELSK